MGNCTSQVQVTNLHNGLEQYWLAKVKKNGKDLRDAPTEIRSNIDIVMAAVKQNGHALRFASPQLKNEKGIVMAALQKSGRTLQYATPEIRSNRKIVISAVQQNGHALQFASPELQNDKEVLLAAIQNHPCGTVLNFAAPEIQNDKDITNWIHWMSMVRMDGCNLQHAPTQMRNHRKIVLTAVSQNGNALEFASPMLQNDVSIVIEAVKQNGLSLEYASPARQNDDFVVAAAVKQNAWALDYATEDMQKDRRFIGRVIYNWIVRVQNKGSNLQYAPIYLHNQKQLVIAAIFSDPNAIKYASEDLKRDPEVLIAAGLLDEHHISRSTTYFDDPTDAAPVKDDTTRKTQSDIQNNKSASDTESNVILNKSTTTMTMTTSVISTATVLLPLKIVLSTRFSLDQSSKSEATNFTKLLKSHDYIQNSFKIYAPNAFDKKTCDPNWTDFDHTCRGTYDTCKLESKFKTGRPTDECCWRYSYRYHLQEAKNTNGFMIQLVESNTSILKKEPPKLGNGQEIEKDMAQRLGLKIFHVYRPINHRFAGGCEWFFDRSHVETVVVAIQSWYEGGCRDMSECVVRP